MAFSSCIGSFGLFNKVLDWNKGISNKFVNEVVFILISPAYAVCGVVDLLVLNTVEFWSGSNPVAKVGHVENVWGSDGRQYAVKTLKDGYEVTKPTGEKVLFTYDEKHRSWSMQAEGQERELFRFNGDGTVEATLPSGEKKKRGTVRRGHRLAAPGHGRRPVFPPRAEAGATVRQGPPGQGHGATARGRPGPCRATQPDWRLHQHEKLF